MNAAPHVDALTILVCAPGHSASKTISAGADGKPEIKQFDAGTYYAAMSKSVTDIAGLSVLLTALEKIPHALVIRGSAKDGVATATVRRTKENFETPDRGHHWVMLDLDKRPVPGTLDLMKDPKAVIEHLVGQLPSEFHDASYHYQLSSSAGFKGVGIVSAHVWFWLETPCTDDELKRWAYEVNEKAGTKLIDTALFNDVQAHYTAAPAFDGVADPFPERSDLVRKKLDAVDLHIPKAAVRSKRSAALGQSSGSSVGFEARLAEIGDHPGGKGFHGPIISATASYVSEHGRENVDTEQLFEQVRDRVLAADRTQHDEGYVEHMASREHIMSAIEGALPKYGDRPASRRPSRPRSGVAPAAVQVQLTREDAQQRLAGSFDKILGLAE